MKLKKTTSYLSVLGVLTTISLPAFSQNFPVLRPEGCSEKQIQIPEGSNAQYYLSKDCKTAYILPKEISPLETTQHRLGPAVEQASCEGALDLATRAREMAKKLDKLRDEYIRLQDLWNERIAAAPREERSELRVLKDEILSSSSKYIDDYSKVLDSARELSPYGKMEGAVVNFTMSLSHGEDINKFASLNRDMGITFQAAKIGDGVLSFTSSADQKDILLKRVIGAQLPGLTPIGNNQYVDSDHKAMNGGLTGMITLSQPSVCNIISGKDANRFSPELITSKDLGTSGFAANYTYDIPVTANVIFNFRAWSESQDLVTKFSDKIISGQFKRDVVAQTLLQGTQSSGVEVEFMSGGTLMSEANEMITSNKTLDIDGDSVYTVLFSEGMEVFTDKILQKMEDLRLIQKSANSPIEAIEGGNVETVNVVRRCSYKPRFGRRSKHVCKNVQEKEVHYVAGQSIRNATVTDTSKTEHKFKVSSELTLAMRHTSAFSVKSEK